MNKIIILGAGNMGAYIASNLAEEFNVADSKAQRLFQRQQLLWEKLKGRMTPKVTNYPVEERKFY